MRDEATADVLEDAADYIEKHGWHKDEFYPGWMDADVPPLTPEQIGESGLPVCAMGAISVAAKTAVFGDRVTDAQEHLTRVLAGDFVSIADWNDAPSRTRQEVLDAFRKAAKRALGGAG